MLQKLLKIILALILSATVYLIMPAEMGEAARRTAFIFALAAMFWSTEPIPLYATSLVVIVLNIFLLAIPKQILDAKNSSYTIFLDSLASPVIILFLGGFVLERVLHKHRIDEVLAGILIRFFGKKSFWISLGFMVTTAFLSMWMSNTATTAMMLAIIIPFLDKLDENDKFRKALILSVAFGANIGGIGTPIGTPPNAIAIGALAAQGVYINFISWVLMALPIVVILIVIANSLLVMIYPAKRKVMDFQLPPPPKIDRKGKLVIIIAVTTVLLWLTSGYHQVPAAVISLLSISVFAVTGVITNADVKSLDWDILILMWGGLALGTAMMVSGLPGEITALPLFQQQGIALVALFAGFAILLSSVMSNTATANLLIPVAIALTAANPVLLSIVVALSCSFAMALPISTPPNAMAFSVKGIHRSDFIVAGGLVTLIALGIMLAGYQWMIPFFIRMS
jgi:solute carrier family 13 (sodium-dependent dicarboxylate transporter), member 2/3/5